MISFREKGPVLDLLTLSHVLAASLGILLAGLTILSIGLGLSFNLGFLGLESIVLILIYALGIKIVYRHESLGSPKGASEVQELEGSTEGKSVYFFFPSALLPS